MIVEKGEIILWGGTLGKVRYEKYSQFNTGEYKFNKILNFWKRLLDDASKERNI